MRVPSAASRAMLLALDTATRLASIALFDGQRLLSEATWHSARQHTVELMPRAVEMLDRAGIGPQDLVAVGVAQGPGSFTGLRVALSVAKGLAAVVLATIPLQQGGGYTISFNNPPLEGPVVDFATTARGASLF